jgi:hypothetical protein
VKHALEEERAALLAERCMRGAGKERKAEEADTRHKLLYSETQFATHHVSKADKYADQWYSKVLLLSDKPLCFQLLLIYMVDSD